MCDKHSDEYRLMKHLLDGYDAGARPAKNSSQPLVVIFGLALHHIIDVVSIRARAILKNRYLKQENSIGLFTRLRLVPFFREAVYIDIYDVLVDLK